MDHIFEPPKVAQPRMKVPTEDADQSYCLKWFVANNLDSLLARKPLLLVHAVNQLLRFNVKRQTICSNSVFARPFRQAD